MIKLKQYDLVSNMLITALCILAIIAIGFLPTFLFLLGGETFTKPVRVGSKLSCPNSKAGKHIAESTRWSWGGDYFGLTAAADSRFHLCGLIPEVENLN